MKRITPTFFSATVFLLLSSFMLSPAATSAQSSEKWTARIVSAQGTVLARGAGEARWKPVELGETLSPGDMLWVREQSRASVMLPNENILRLDQGTTITLVGVEEERTSLIDLLMGAIYFFSHTPRSLKVVTPFVNAVVEGTEFLVRAGPDQTSLTVFKGRVVAANEAGSLSLGSGESAVVQRGQAPLARTVLRPGEAVQWAIYYPPVVDYRPADFPDDAGATGWHETVRKSLQYYWTGDPARALSNLEGVVERVSDPRFYIYRAAVLLTVGRADEAGVDIERALSLEPANSHALSLQSIIALAQNDEEKARALARKAVESAPDSSTARVALSYAQQAHFDIQGARTSLEEAVEMAPENGLAWARLAELWLALGYLEKALDAAARAVSLNPHVARAQTVLGFAYLARFKTKESSQAFEKAIVLDQADPLPRLGLGLATIRRGDLDAGRGEIEIAANLDPDNSLIRSYLGKAFFEEKRDKQAGEQFAMAKELDPRDPTPWFYDAIRKQTLNRPVEALQDLQRSIELNDNRAVYRSRLLLDEDLAARSASLGRVYSDLGFQQLALTEGWKSLNADPANHSAHRFLADSYLSLPRHEVARISELLQSQLLQPINIMPVQPQFKESNLAVIEQAGLLNPSFNEFTSLFARNRLALQASGIVGDHDTFGDELIQSGVWGRTSYSVGQFHFQTDGFRRNNDQEVDIYDVLTQVSLSHRTSVQAEVRFTDVEGGDLGLRFDPDDAQGNFRQDRRTESVRLGLHHEFTPHSETIASFIFEDADTETDNFIRPLDFNDETTNRGYMGEIQHLLRYDRFSVIGGAGHFSSDRKDVLKQTVFLPGDVAVPLPPEVDEPDVDHTNFYVYSLIRYPEDVTWTLGSSVDSFRQDDSDQDRDQLSPKLGVTWEVLPTTTLRAALFRTLRRALISSQTIEPTQVAGFNQFFDDPQSTDAWRYGVGVDQKLLSTLYGGAEWSMRDLEVPRDQARRVDREEQLVRTYLYWAAHPRMALSLEYQYERLESDPRSPGVALVVESDTHRVPLGISFFHPSGFLARLGATYVFQTGRFKPQGGIDIIEGDDHFVVCDAAVGYRLPDRWGIITLEGRNLLDEEFRFQDTDPANPAIAPERSVLLRFTLSF